MIGINSGHCTKCGVSHVSILEPGADRSLRVGLLLDAPMLNPATGQVEMKHISVCRGCYPQFTSEDERIRFVQLAVTKYLAAK